MALARQKSIISAKTWLQIAAALAGLWLFMRLPGVVITLGFMAGVIFILFVFPARQHGKILACADRIIQHHAEPLARRRAQLIRQDAYGKLITDKWQGEIDHFVVHHIRPSLTAWQQVRFDRDRAKFVPLIAARIEAIVSGQPVFESFSPSMTPQEFEAFCAEQLRRAGWNAYVTQASRDQGVDVIAEKNKVRVVLQCKLYSNPVGNKAVQEIVAGRAHGQAQHGAVVTNSSYTSAAEELASTNGILLLHYSDLTRLDSVVRGTPDLARAAAASH